MVLFICKPFIGSPDPLTPSCRLGLLAPHQCSLPCVPQGQVPENWGQLLYPELTQILPNSQLLWACPLWPHTVTSISRALGVYTLFPSEAFIYFHVLLQLIKSYSEVLGLGLQQVSLGDPVRTSMGNHLFAGTWLALHCGLIGNDWAPSSEP